jgi:pimeloyl-ACP methyl ester carboxylesterase
MRVAQVRPDGSGIRWVELPGRSPARVYLHGLGASSAPYYARATAHPDLAGYRSLLMDLLGFGISDRPEDAAYTLEEHADTVAAALSAAGVRGADLIGHSMGGAVAIVLAARHPDLVSRLILIDANLDPAPRTPLPGSSYISTFTEQEFLERGWSETLERVGPHWAATMRLAGRTALYRSAVHLARATTPTMRETLLGLPIPRTFLHPQGDAPEGAEKLAAAGVRLVSVPDCGHNIMLDNPRAFVAELATALAPADPLPV